MKRRRSNRRRTRRAYGGVWIGGVFAATLLVAAVLGGALFISNPDKPAATGTEIERIVIGFAGQLGTNFAGEVVAERAGLFSGQGIDVKLGGQAVDGDPVQAVVSGAALFGVVDSISFLDARSKGQPIVAFAASFLESATAFFALEKSGIRTPQDFVGKRVARKNGVGSTVFYDALLRSAGVSRSQVRETVTDVDLDALLNDRVDVIPGQIGHEDFLLSRQGIQYNTIRMSDYGIHVPGTVYFTTEKILRDRPSLVQRFLQSVITGWTSAYADRTKSVPFIVAEGNGRLSAEEVEFELALQKDLIMPVGRRIAEFDDRQWKQLRAIMANARLIDESIDLGAAVNYDVLREVYRKPITFGN